MSRRRPTWPPQSSASRVLGRKQAAPAAAAAPRARRRRGKTPSAAPGAPRTRARPVATASLDAAAPLLRDSSAAGATAPRGSPCRPTIVQPLATSCQLGISPRPHLKMLSRMWARAALGECRVAGRSRTGQALSRVFCGAGRPVLPAVAASAARPGASCRGEGLRCGSMRLAPRCACLMGDHAAQGTWRGLGRNGDGMAGTHSAAAGCWYFPPWAPRSPRSPAAATRAVSARFRRAGMVYARTCREKGGLTCRTSERVCVLRTLGSRSQGRPRRWDTQGRRG